MIAKIAITNTEAFKYLRKQLALGKTLSHLLGLEPIEAGSVYAFVPEGVSSTALQNFERGGIYPGDVNKEESSRLVPITNEATPIILEIIRDFIYSNTDNCCLFEEPLAFPTDPWVANSKIPHVDLNQAEMFYFFDQQFSDGEKIEETLKISSGHFFCAFWLPLRKRFAFDLLRKMVLMKEC